MLFSLNWIREYVDIPIGPDELSLKLTMAGFEVERVEEFASGITGVVTAEILTIGKHPNADRLTLCSVKTPDRTYSIVCGAKNMKDGDRVALALPGATLPGGVILDKATIRGVESEGMMLSTVELGISKDSQGIMILPADTPIGIDINDALGLKDRLLEVSITPNRPDCMSIRGLAREISAILDLPFRDKEIKPGETAGDINEKIKVSIENTGLCKRYAARVIVGATIGHSPEWLRKRLEGAGIRSINNIVDATNYIMLELGQPLHAFDLDKIKDSRLIIRNALDGERITTIDEKERVLDKSMLVVADAKAPQAIAGVMGGKNSEISVSTKNIVLEGAWFLPSSVRKTSRALGLSTDSSYRFERGVDMEGVGCALDAAAELIHKISGGRIVNGKIDAYAEKFKPGSITLRLKKARDILGMEIEKDEARSILKRLGMGVADSGEDSIDVTPPCFRMDVTMESDIVEEMARLKGYDKIPATMPMARLNLGKGMGEIELRNNIKNTLVSNGFFEVINYSFISDKSFRIFGKEDRIGLSILNPLTEDEVVLRDTLVPSLLDNLVFNLSKKTLDVRIFELRPVFIARRGGHEEIWKAGALIHGHRRPFQWNESKEWCDFYDIKGTLDNILKGCAIDKVVYENTGESTLLHPGKGAKVIVDGREVCLIGQLHPDIQDKYGLKMPVHLFELNLRSLVRRVGKTRQYAPLPRFPQSQRDIAFIAADIVPYREIADSIRGLDVKLIENVEVFDVYCGEGIPAGKRSMAIRITYRSLERTLKHEEVEGLHSTVIDELKKRFNALIRV